MRNSIKASVVLVFAVLVVSCNPLKLIEKYLDDIQIVATPKILEVHGNSVEYSLKGRIPAKAFHKKAVATLTPVVHYGGKTLNLDPIVLKGEKAEGSGKIIKVKEGGSFDLSGSFDYDPAMEGKDLYIDLNFKVCKSGSESCGDFKKEKVALGMISTSQSVKGTEDVYFAGDFKPAKRKFQRSIYFLINRWTVRTSESSGKQVEELRNFAKTDRLELQGISINSFASPDGELRINQNLTDKRSASSFRFLTGLLEKLDISASDENLYKKQSLEEDWKGFRALVAASNIADKSKAIQIIDSKQSNDDKETAIKALDSWPSMLDDMMPKLRRSDVILTGIVKNRSIDELNEAAKTSFESFTSKELLLYASEAKSNADKAKAYQAYIDMKPKSIVGYNNLGAVHILNGDYDKAKKVLDQGIGNAGDNDTLYNNMGICYRAMDNNDQAMVAYSKAAKAGIAVGYNQSIIHIMNGDYDAALSSQPAARCDYNTALAALLKGNYDDAISEINCQKAISADDYYLRAIAFARKSDPEEMGASLSLAIKEDKSLSQKATNDMEFYSYWSNKDFTSVLK